jgi:uncharacterized protein YceK
MQSWFAVTWMVALPFLLGGCASTFHRIAGAPCRATAPADIAADWEPANGTCRESQQWWKAAHQRAVCSMAF